MRCLRLHGYWMTQLYWSLLPRSHDEQKNINDQDLTTDLYKSSFRILGWTGYIFVMGLFIIFLMIGFFIKFGTNAQLIPIISVGLLLLFMTLLVWRKILTEMNQIEITESTIEIKNPITKRTRRIEKQKVKGFKDIFKNGYTILIISHNDKVIAKIHDYYYKDFQGLINNLGIKYLERVPTTLDKIFKN